MALDNANDVVTDKGPKKRYYLGSQCNEIGPWETTQYHVSDISE